jgi:hypothetical protein
MNRGFVIMAQNTSSVDYVKCAEQLSNSIRKVMPDANVTIITDKLLPYGDLAVDSDWKLINDWQVYEASPYEYTIKLEADMLIPKDISYWWNILQSRDLVVSSTIRDYTNQISNVKVYRNFIINNQLPDVYNAITYFKKSETADKFYKIVRHVFENWDDFKAMLKCDTSEIATTDWVYSIACHIMGVENTTLPNFTEFSFIHMKKFINNLMIDDWTKELLVEFNPSLKVNTIVQEYPFHYHVKSFSDVIGEHNGK